MFPKQNLTSNRKSNIESLRIIAMILVLIVHFCGAALGLPNPKGNIDDISSSECLKLITESIAIIGVNLFILISGYFGINTRWQTIFKFTTQCLTYSLGIYLIGWTIGIWKFDWNTIIHSIQIYTHSYYWFVPAYLGLILIAPILNTAIKHLQRKQLLTIIIAFSAITFYAGWWHKMQFSDRGYTTINFALLYLIARYIATYIPSHKTPSKHLRITYISTYIIATTGIFTTALFTDIAFHYNSPLVIIAATSLMLLFTTFSYQNKIINFIASSAFSVYLIHMHPLIWIRLKNTIIHAANTHNTIEFITWCASAIIIIFTSCIAIDKTTSYITRPITTTLTNITTKIQQLITKKQH